MPYILMWHKDHGPEGIHGPYALLSVAVSDAAQQADLDTKGYTWEVYEFNDVPLTSFRKDPEQP